MLAQIKEESKSGLVLCFSGVGSAFAKKNDNTSLIIAKNGKTLLVDAGISTLAALHKQGIEITDFDYYYFTHDHDDHIGSVQHLLYRARYVTKQKINLIITKEFARQIWEGSLRPCSEVERPCLSLSHYANIIEPLQASPCGYIIRLDNGLLLDITRTMHCPMKEPNLDNQTPLDFNWSTALMIDGKVIFTGDTQFDPQLIQGGAFDDCKAIFHDCQLFEPETVHATYAQLKTLPPELRAKMYLTHYGDTFEQFDPRADGFQCFTKPWTLYKF